MNEKPPQFVVTDKRKFTADGAIREGFTPPPEELETPYVASPGTAPAKGPVAIPSRGKVEPAPLAAPLKGDDLHAASIDEEDLSDEAMPAPTARESAEQNSAYQKSSKQLDEMLKQANPGIPPAEEVNFEALVQSLYMSAMVQLGGNAQPGEKPRVDIVGARQNIDLLGMLVDKTKGNLSTREKKLLDTLLFDLRMAFLQITNAIAKSATRPPSPGGLV